MTAYLVGIWPLEHASQCGHVGPVAALAEVPVQLCVHPGVGVVGGCVAVQATQSQRRVGRRRTLGGRRLRPLHALLQPALRRRRRNRRGGGAGARRLRLRRAATAEVALQAAEDTLWEAW